MAKITTNATKEKVDKEFTLASKGLTKEILMTKYLFLGAMVNTSEKTYGHSNKEFSCYVWAEILTRDMFMKTKVKHNVEELAYILFLCGKKSQFILAYTNKRQLE